MIMASQLAYAAALPEQKVDSKVSSESSKELSKPQTDEKPEQSVKSKSPKMATTEKKEMKATPTLCPDPPCK